MSVAIEKTISSITGSSLTTIAGFLALCIMDLALGKDIGLVMAKGVLFGVICTVTVLPSMILVFDKLIHKYQHKVLLPKFEKSSEFIIKHHKVLVVIGAIILIPAIIGNNNTKVYYNLDESLPKDLLSIVANDKLKTEYNMMSTNIILVRDDLEGYKINQMIEELKNIDVTFKNGSHEFKAVDNVSLKINKGEIFEMVDMKKLCLILNINQHLMK